MTTKLQGFNSVKREKAEIGWSNLPEELLAIIVAKCKETPINILRFRAVCSTWRRSISPSPKFSQFPYDIQDSINDGTLNIPYDNPSKPSRVLVVNSIYHLELPHLNPSTASSSVEGWFFKVRETEPGRYVLKKLLTDAIIRPLPEIFPKKLSLLDYRISEICKEYVVHMVMTHEGGYRLRDIVKAVICYNSAWSSTRTNGYALLAIDCNRKLNFLKLGDDQWVTLIDDDRLYYKDIINYKGRFCAVTDKGKCVTIESSLKVTEIAPSTCNRNPNGEKHLVESLEDLFLVHVLSLNPFRCKIYKLNEVEHKWEEVSSLGDRVFFLGYNCTFSISAQDFSGCRGNCIYLSDPSLPYGEEDDSADSKEDDSLPYSEKRIAVFNLEDDSGGPLASFPGYFKTFWPPPTWLMSNPLV